MGCCRLGRRLARDRRDDHAQIAAGGSRPVVFGAAGERLGPDKLADRARRRPRSARPDPGTHLCRPYRLCLLVRQARRYQPDRKSTRLNSSHMSISYAVFCLKKKKKKSNTSTETTKKHKQRASIT